MTNKRMTLFLLTAALTLMSACAPQASDSNAHPRSGGLVTIDKAPFVIAARSALSQKLGIPEDQVTFVSAGLEQWTDNCLGLGRPAESCLRTDIPGYRVTLEAQGIQYEVHTDETGSLVRIKD